MKKEPNDIMLYCKRLTGDKKHLTKVEVITFIKYHISHVLTMLTLQDLCNIISKIGGVSACSWLHTSRNGVEILHPKFQG